MSGDRSPFEIDREALFARQVLLAKPGPALFAEQIGPPIARD